MLGEKQDVDGSAFSKLRVCEVRDDSDTGRDRNPPVRGYSRLGRSGKPEEDLSPSQFEHFARHLLTAYGFVQVIVTQRAKDGGIDGHGMLKVGLARMAVAFQCKRWEGNVPRPEVDKFRGAIQGEFEQGLFFTTSDFTKGATDASIKKGAVPIILLNGESIIDLMIDKEFGLQKKPLQIYEDQLDTIFGDLK